MSYLHQSIKEQNLKKVQQLIEREDYSVNYTGFFGWNDTPLSYAVQTGNLEIAEYLIEQGASVNHRGYWGWGADTFSVAKTSNNLSMQALLLPKADVDNKIQLAKSLLSSSLQENNNWALKKLLDANFSFDQEFSDSLLFKAVNASNCMATQALINSNLDINLESKHRIFERTALIEATSLNLVEISKILISAGADVQTVDANMWTPLHYAAASLGATPLMSLLLEHGADANALDAYGRGPLFYCLTNPQAINLLGEYDVSVNLPDIDGITPLEIAILNDSSVGVKALAELGANLESNPNIGFSPLHYAVEKGSINAAMALVKSGASILGIEDGKTAIELAHELGDKVSFSYLKAQYAQMGLDLPETVMEQQPATKAIAEDSDILDIATVLSSANANSFETASTAEITNSDSMHSVYLPQESNILADVVDMPIFGY